ncbi:hypothetical protein WKV44_10505 [Spirochaetia bacterium 38H-sp]|uniref:Uncharacterized protein n=1 Tax=Rarispira pelagica TaxID=3141764 RepID=A0ABU9UE76_9SPIR
MKVNKNVVMFLLVLVFVNHNINCQTTEKLFSEIEIKGTIFYVLEQNNYLLVGYRDDEYNLKVDKIEIISDKLKYIETINDKRLFYKYEEIFETKQNLIYSKYEKEIVTDIKKRKCNILYDKNIFDGRPMIYYSMAKESPDSESLLLLYTCEDGRSFFASQIVCINIKNREIKISYLADKNSILFEYTKNIGWISNDIIYYDVSSGSKYDIIKLIRLNEILEK